ncbi:ABC-type multidrug transport system, ATPase component [Clostridium cavendishii DSM 21758]|uniref:ABC-type multidrug transport system, ATPase component n=1 Tax=Clostridium cavendishii DSM 21758 TaxID=1121302 RepID=A0A1M6J1L0_9CLOT|nr:ATP-binding cassette domain-containing protein [Clostridium cavendishii]SHJ40624.1 ABC-type multidrug transport system, ATPase component [Clostridium cavendishii DSM 21758]
MNKVMEVKNVSKNLKGRKVSNNISFNLFEGDICGFIGPNGAGKTTMIRLITGLISPNSGQILLNDIDVHRDRISALQNLGAIVESPIFFPYLTGRRLLKNLARLNPNMSKEEQRKKVSEVLEIVSLESRADDKVSTYSLGMKQRLGIAQALLNNPKIIILDEPANGLDPMGMIELRNLILKLNKEMKITFFISSHLLDELQKICNRLIVIKEGSLVWSGNTRDLLAKSSKGESLEDVFIDLMCGNF